VVPGTVASGICTRYCATAKYLDIIIIIFLGPTSTKPQAEIMELNKVNGCNDISFGDHSILEGDRIPPLKSHYLTLLIQCEKSKDNACLATCIIFRLLTLYQQIIIIIIIHI